MKRFSLILPLVCTLFLIFSPAAHCRTVVFFVGGWKMTAEQMESFSSSVPESVKVKFLLPDSLSALVRPWYCADLIYDHISKNGMLDDELIIVAYSHGGTVTQWLLSSHSELRVKQLILVGSPIGGYKFVPPNNFFSNDFPKDLPIFVIAGNKGQDAWFLRDQNDGVVDLESALDIREHNLKDFAVFYADHSELKTLPEVQSKISGWIDLGLILPPNILADTIKAARPALN